MSARIAAEVPSWDILICSIEERWALLASLLMVLARQVVPGVGVHVFVDNLTMKVGDKRQVLVESSKARYISFIDDDDMVAPNYVSAIREALRKTPDQVGFKVLWTTDGMPCLPVYHSLVHGGWDDAHNALYRDISHLNPIKRRLAKRIPFGGGNYEDRRWVDGMRALGCVKREVFIDEELYHYRFKNGDSHLIERAPYEFVQPRPVQQFPFVTWVG